MADAATFGIEISEDRSRCAVAKAWRESPGRLAVKVVGAGLAPLAPGAVGPPYMADDPVAVALDPRSQSSTLCAPLADRGVMVRRLGAEDVAVAHGEFMGLVSSGGLKHFDQPELTAAVRGAQQRPLSGARALDRRVASDQSPLTSSEFAVWVLLRWEELSQPGVWEI